MRKKEPEEKFDEVIEELEELSNSSMKSGEEGDFEDVNFELKEKAFTSAEKFGKDF